MSYNREMISLVDVDKLYKTGDVETRLFDKLNLSIQANESIAITGPSGSGKSSLLRMIAGLEAPSSGDIKIYNQSIYALSDQQRADLRRLNFGFIFQSFRLFPQLTVFENVQLACDISNVKSSNDVALKWLSEVDLLNQRHQKPDTLSEVNNCVLRLHVH